MRPLLTTEVHLPLRRRGLVARPQLSERLGHADEAALTLVSAPAGFRKRSPSDLGDSVDHHLQRSDAQSSRARVL